MVLVEVLNFATRQGEHIRALAADKVKDWLTDPRIEVVPQTDDQFRDALDLYGNRLDKEWSLADCASFLLMGEMDIREALAYDRNFEQAGFVALLRTPTA